MVEILQDFLMKKQTTTEFFKNVSIIPIGKANGSSTKWQIININGVTSGKIADLMLGHLKYGFLKKSLNCDCTFVS